MNGESCSTASCSLKKWFLSSLLVFVLAMAIDWFVHGYLLMDTYKATANLWRSEEEMQQFFPFCIARHVLQAMIFVALFGCWRAHATLGAVGSKDCPYKKSLGFGLLVGMMIGLQAASSYFYMPIPHQLAVWWLVSEALKWAVVSAALYALMGRCGNQKAGT